ncbi:MAG: flagellar hook-associated protein FlgL [Planctomycetota bacterium]|nr:flagellar hook-associated protein FlgL [Planctomycetota bacterium]
MSSTNQVYNSILSSMSANMDAIARMQEQVSTGQKINRASDSPSDPSMIMLLQSQADYIGTFTKNINVAQLNLQQASTGMQSISDSLSRVKTLLTQAANGTLSQANRIAIGQEVDSLLEEAVGQVNSQTAGVYVFGGSQMTAPPYKVTRENGQIVAVDYVGSEASSSVPVGMGLRQANVMVGDKVFRYDRRLAPVFAGHTGLAAGSGTSSVRGDVRLTLTHTATTYAGATGLIAGSNAAAGDTILGDAHKITLDADHNTLALDDGTAVSFNPGAEPNVKLTNAAGDVVYVDTTALAAGLSGTIQVDLQATGRMSIDGGKTSTALATFADNQAVTDSQTGRVLYVNAAALARTGDEPIRVPGTYDVFSTLIAVRDTLMNTRHLSTADQIATLSRALDSVNEVSGNLTTGMTSAGAQLQALDNLTKNLAALKDNSDTQIASLRDADVAQVSVELARVPNFYQMTLASAAKILNISLLNYM